MLWFNRLIAVFALLALGACGFAPAYGPNGAAQGGRGQIVLDDPTDKNTFGLVARLEERLGRTDTGPYRLSYQLQTDQRGLAISGSNSVTRINLNGTLAFQITPVGGDAPVYTDEITTFTSYSTTASTVATAAAAEDAARRLMVILADQVVTRLLASAGTWAQ
jgi:LPS-assembly lipoprotein